MRTVAVRWPIVTVARTVATAVLGDAPSHMPILLTPYDAHAFGNPIIDKHQRVIIPGPMQVAGRLRIEPDESCDGACAYFIPDSTSAATLPRHIPAPGVDPIPVEHILLFDARPLLVSSVGPTEAERLLQQGFVAFELPAAAALRDFMIYVACDKTHYDAEAVELRITTAAVAATVAPNLGGC